MDSVTRTGSAGGGGPRPLAGAGGGWEGRGGRMNPAGWRSASKAWLQSACGAKLPDLAAGGAGPALCFHEIWERAVFGRPGLVPAPG